LSLQTSAELVWTKASHQMLDQEVQKYFKQLRRKIINNLLIVAIFVDDGFIAATIGNQINDLV